MTAEGAQRLVAFQRLAHPARGDVARRAAQPVQLGEALARGDDDQLLQLRGRLQAPGPRTCVISNASDPLGRIHSTAFVPD
ncbi:hypothetical protein ACWD4L_33170, partial [Streptomyces sp. NPDC002596]